jgi:hypothetical protein
MMAIDIYKLDVNIQQYGLAMIIYDQESLQDVEAVEGSLGVKSGSYLAQYIIQCYRDVITLSVLSTALTERGAFKWRSTYSAVPSL